MRYDDTFLPGADEKVRCAVFSERLGLDPGGTALWVDEIHVVDVLLPWPKPVWAKDGFTAVPEWILVADESGRRVRLLAAVPEDDIDGARIVVHRRLDGAAFSRTEHQVAETEVAALLELLLTTGPDASPSTVADVADPVREVLICGQGSHDVCCGSRGPALIAEVIAARPDVVVRRVSHTGGHRFAPTGMTLPDGRMWGRLDLGAILIVLDRRGSPAEVADRCRGWTGAAEGAAQVAERAVFADVDDWSFDEQSRSVEILESGPARTRCRVTSGDQQWLVDVTQGRAVPTIACGQPGGLPAKPGVEWRVESLRAV